MKQQHWLLKVETAWTLPFFLLSWIICSVWYAVRAGALMAASDSELKQKVLDGTSLPEKRDDRKPKKILS